MNEKKRKIKNTVHREEDHYQGFYDYFFIEKQGGLQGLR